MRLYAFLLVAGAALCARAASIPVAETEKKLIDIVPDNLDKLPEKTSSEQELIDQANTINDVDNKLRAKPEDIPVEVIVENAQPVLKTDEEQDEEIIRPAIDLRNPGPPQRQEHETQNPEFYASEQQTVALFKQGIQDAQNVLRQGFQGITDGIQHIAETNEPIQTIQLSIQSLRDSFTAQLVKVNATIQSYLNTESASIDKPGVEQTKAGFLQVEQGLSKLRNDFNREVSTLSSGVDIVAALKADSEATNESSGSTNAPGSEAPTSAPVWPIVQIVNNIRETFQHNLQIVQESFNNVIQGQFNQGSSTAAPSAEIQSDSQVTSAPAATGTTNIFEGIQNGLQNQFNQIGSFFNPGQGTNQGQAQNPSAAQNPGQQGILGFFNPQQVIDNISDFWRPKPSTQAPQGTPVSSGQSAQTPSKPEETAVKPDSKPESHEEPAKPAAGAEAPAQADAITPAGPIRQILQNNPITKGIAGAVQRLQNMNNPEKPRDEGTAEQVNNLEQDNPDVKPEKKGHGPNTGELEITQTIT